MTLIIKDLTVNTYDKAHPAYDVLMVEHQVGGLYLDDVLVARGYVSTPTPPVSISREAFAAMVKLEKASEPCTYEYTENALVVKVSGAKYTFRFTGEDVSVVPTETAQWYEKTAKIDAPTKAVLSWVAKAATDGKTRPILANTYSDGGVTLACDGYRAHIAYMDTSAWVSDNNLIMNKQSDSTEGRYPDVQYILADARKTISSVAVILRADTLIEAVKGVYKQDSLKRVQIATQRGVHGYDHTISVFNHDATSETKLDCSVDFSHDPMTLKGDYILQALAPCKKDTRVTISIWQSGVIFDYEVKGVRHTALIMCMQR